MQLVQLSETAVQLHHHNTHAHTAYLSLKISEELWFNFI